MDSVNMRHQNSSHSSKAFLVPARSWKLNSQKSGPGQNAETPGSNLVLVIMKYELWHKGIG